MHYMILVEMLHRRYNLRFLRIIMNNKLAEIKTPKQAIMWLCPQQQ